MSSLVENIKNNYPLHYLIWHNDYQELEKILSSNNHDLELRDCRGRTPLLLAVTLGHLESARVLIEHDANVSAETKENWTALQESVATGDPELVQLLLERRDAQRSAKRVKGIPILLQRLKEAPDFYVEMKWEFASWVPLVSRMCPSDTYKVYKQGSNVRIDTTLLGFDQNNWQRGSRTFVFKGTNEGALMMEIDHTRQDVWVEEMRVLPAASDSPNDYDSGSALSTEAISSRLTNPIVTTYIDTDKISFERNKAGIWGWRSDKTEMVNSYSCKVFSATNVELVTKTRTEHLSEEDKTRATTPRTPLQNFLGMAENEGKSQKTDESAACSNVDRCNPCNITLEEYFNPNISLNGRDIGRPKEITSKVQKFKATLWLCEDYPLTLQEQIMPIVDLMAISSSHFAKLKDFIQMQLPSGFPVKIEIPLFHVLNARITFGNIFGCDQSVPGVTCTRDNEKLLCFVCDSCFEPPSGYKRVDSKQLTMDDEDNLIQFAIQQSLMDAGTERDQVDIWEALRAERPMTPNIPVEEQQLQRAIQASLSLESSSPSPIQSPREPDDLDLLQAIQQSKAQQEEEERRKLEEEAVLEKIIKLSLIEK